MRIFVADVGGTYIKHAVMSEDAEIFERGKIPTPTTNREDFLQTLAELYKASGAEGIALSLPGIIDAERGLCITSGALGYNDGCFIADELEKICGVKVSLENDANCAGLAEAKIGSLADVEDGFVMVFGTGIGGAFIKNRELYRGKNFISGEISFLFANIEDIDGEKIFANMCGVPALLKIYAKNKNLSTDKVSGEKFFQAVHENEPAALDCLKSYTRKIAAQIFNIQLILDPEKFAIGGGISAQKIFIDSIRESLAEVYAACIVDFPHVEVFPCKFRNDANLIGALFNFVKS